MSGFWKVNVDMLNVLIIDDDSQVASVIAMALEALGHQVRVSNDSSETETLCSEVNPDLVLLDMMMPGRSGIDLLAPVQQTCPNAVICIMTGLVDDNLMKQALKAGAWNILYKPYNLDELNELLELSALLSEAARLEQEPAADMRRSEYKLNLSGADPFAPRDIERLVRAARACGASDDIARRRLPVVAAELLGNARVHGAKSLAGKSYGADLIKKNDNLSLVVYDDGDGFDWKRITANRTLRITGGGAPGLHLVRSLSDRLSFTDNGRKVIAEFRISR